MLSHRNLVTGVISSAAHWEIPDATVFLFCFPLCHVGGYAVLVNHLRAAQSASSALRQRHVPRPRREWKVTQTGLAPTMIAFLLDHPGIEDHDLGTLEAIGTGRLPSPPSAAAGMDALGCDFYQGFGMSETAATSCTSGSLTTGAQPPARHTSSPPPDASWTSRTSGSWTRTSTTSRPASPARWSSAATRSCAVLARARADRCRVPGRLVPHGRRRPPDAEGMVYIVDRIKDMIITGGENVASCEVEQVLYRHPSIADAAVFGIPDPRWGESVCAAVVLRPDSAADRGGDHRVSPAAPRRL